MEKWKYYLVILCQYHFDVWFQPERIHMNAFSKHSLDLLGYRSSLRLNLSVVRSQMLEISCLIDNFMYNLDTGIPIIPLMRSLAKMKFCKTAGHPISKSNWADSSDSDIIRRFVHIGRNLSHYYSGSSKKMSLYRIHYILRFSCIKTLAHKHKSSVRAFLKKLGSEFFEDFFAHEESIFFSRASSISQRLCRRRVWHLDILSINEMLN
ncbi:hypothetical protein Tsubulata_039193 [Turnera subulata]|uniref:Maturase K n=1 Tax=Turnera subulata TaxID=218843 RepID=A0A9Q0F649_9ROSI|nr:hypothetical protein Tsubulata_039193 [Turnera subulata]